MKSSEIREMYLNFFKERDHLVLPSFSLVPQKDPTLLLIGAGMAPLKPYFTGEKVPPHKRIATCQKCVRTPDIERVGLTPRHATFFEMLGNFSFGDYFKVESIECAWELVTKGYGIPEEKLLISVYENDDEAFDIWKDHIGIPASKIYRLGKEDNFWEIGQGPCGPCSEIHYDLGPEYGCGRPDCEVGCDCDRFLEIWNLVFTQFNKEADGTYSTLENKNIDTGAGLERFAMVLQGVSSLFEIDIIRPLLDFFAEKAAVRYGMDEKTDVSLRIITEHFRGVSFMVGDGVLPSNEGRGYVLRRILRRAVRHGKMIALEAPFLYEGVPLLAELMGDTYPELRDRLDYITRIIKIEEERFKETLGQGMEILEGHIKKLQDKGETVLAGDIAFKLYDTFGFPIDLTREILAERGLSVAEEGFNRALEEQRERARLALYSKEQEDEIGAVYSLVKGMETRFVGYDSLEAEAEILGLVDVSEGKLLHGAEESEKELCLVLDRSAFYAESGGQVGDTGVLYCPEGAARVFNTVPGPGEQVLHFVKVEEGKLRQGDRVKAIVDRERREGIVRNHTATHLLHRALKDTLGDHVNQAGSLVDHERLRFDFTHFAHLEEEELRAVEEKVNEQILQNLAVETIYTTLDEALGMGAAALFDEKYGDRVRLVNISDYSLELCGGTHVHSTSEIGLFKIIHEGGIGAGHRRIEALTGINAYRFVLEMENILRELAFLIKTSPEMLVEKVDGLLGSYREMQRRLKQLEQKLAQQRIQDLLEKTDNSIGVPVLSSQVEVENMEALREYLDRLRDKMGSGIIMLGTVSNGKVLLAAAVTRDLVEQGYHAGRLIGEVAKITGGGGGGRPDMAQAGGKDPEKLPKALAKVLALVKEQQGQV